MKVENCGRIIFQIRFCSCFTCEYRLAFTANITPLGISLAPLAQISIYILSPHPPSPRRRSPFPTKIASQSGEGWYEWKADATAVPRSSAEPPPFRHAFSVPPFPLSGKSTPQSSAKPSGRRLVSDNFQLTEVNDAAAMLCPTRLFDSSGRTIFIDEREGYSSSRTSLAFSAIIAPAEPLVTLPKSKR